MDLSLLSRVKNTPAHSERVAPRSPPPSKETSPQNSSQRFNAARRQLKDIPRGNGLNHLAEISQHQQGGVQEQEPQVRTDGVLRRLGNPLKKLQNNFSIQPQHLQMETVANTLKQQGTGATDELDHHKTAPVSDVQHPDPKELVSPFEAQQKLGAAPFPDSKIEAIGTAYQKHLKSQFEAAVEREPTGKLSQYYQLSLLLNAYQNGKMTGDEDALRVMRLNAGKMKSRLKKLSQDKGLQLLFQQMQAQAVKKVLGNSGQRDAARLANHILSDGFQNKLKAMPSQERKKVMGKEMLKLRTLNPRLAQQMLQRLALQQLEHQLESKLNTPGPDQVKAQRALNKSFAQEVNAFVVQNYGSSSKMNKIYDMFGEAFKASAQGKMGAISHPEVFNALIDKAAEHPSFKALGPELQGDIRKAKSILKSSQLRTGILSKAALFVGMQNFAQAKTLEAKLSGSSTTLEGLSGLKATGELLELFPDSSKVLRAAPKFLEVLGPLGDSIGIAADVLGAVREQRNEDPIGRNLKITSAVAGGTGLGAGLYMMVAASSGPAAPILVGGAAAVGVGTAVAESLFAESDQTGAVRRALRDTGIADLSERNTQGLDRAEDTFHFDPVQTRVEYRKLTTSAARLDFLHARLDRKALFVSDADALDFVKLIQDMPPSDRHALFAAGADSGLNTRVVARQIGDSPQALARFQKILEQLPDSQIKSAQMRDYLLGLSDGQSEQLNKILSGSTGEALAGQLQYQDLVQFIQDPSSSVRDTYRLLNHSDWSAFNRLATQDMEAVGDLIRKAKPEEGLQLGRLAAWAFKTGADPATRGPMLSALQVFLDSAGFAQGAQASVAFIEELQVVHEAELDGVQVLQQIAEDRTTLLRFLELNLESNADKGYVDSQALDYFRSALEDQ